jgi:hypothetical protein
VGSEAIVLFIPLGAVLLAVMAYRSARGPERIYPLVAFAVTLGAAGYIAYQQPSGFVMWFLIAFALISLPVGALAHFARWIVRRAQAARTGENAT